MTKAFVDLAGAGLTEDQRVEAIVETVKLGKTVGVFVEDSAKADRYVRKVTERLPEAAVLYRGKLPPAYLIKFGPKTH